MKKFFVAAVAALSVTLASCGPNVQPQYQQTAANCVQGDPNCVGQVVQQGGGFVNDHPYLTAGAAAAGAYYLGKRSERRNGYGNGYGYRNPPRTRIIERTIVRPSYSRPYSYSAPRSSYVTRSYSRSYSRR